MHIEGTLEPDLALKLSQRNNIKLPFTTTEEHKNLLNFADLQSFLNLYYQMIQVLQTEEDFYDLMCAYINRARANNIRHAELFFDAQIHLSRGIPFSVVINGLTRACTYGEEQGVSYSLLLCLLRDRPLSQAVEAFEAALPYKEKIIGIGLASAEKGYPGTEFAPLFERARSLGFLTVAHAGEEGPAEYIWEALNILKVSRIAHGIACVTDPKLIERLAHDRIPLTMCPLSNLKLRVIRSLSQHPAKYLLDRGVCVTINSDDPAYFGGYLNENMLQLAQAISLSLDDVCAFYKNSFEASFLSTEKKAAYCAELQEIKEKAEK